MSILKLKAIIRLIFTKQFFLITIPKEGQTTKKFYRVYGRGDLEWLKNSIVLFDKKIDKQLTNEL